MKVLLLSDAEYKAYRSTVGDKAKTNGKLKLPSAKDLVAMSRAGEEPEAFAALREQQEALAEASDQIRDRMHALVREADAVGVKPGALAAWSGYSARRIHQIARGGGA